MPAGTLGVTTLPPLALPSGLLGLFLTSPLSTRQVLPSLTQAAPEAPHHSRGAQRRVFLGWLELLPSQSLGTCAQCTLFLLSGLNSVSSQTHICPQLVLCLNEHTQSAHSWPMRSAAVKQLQRIWLFTPSTGFSTE